MAATRENDHSVIRNIVVGDGGKTVRFSWHSNHPDRFTITSPAGDDNPNVPDFLSGVVDDLRQMHTGIERVLAQGKTREAIFTLGTDIDKPKAVAIYENLGGRESGLNRVHEARIGGGNSNGDPGQAR
ncbi:MAG: hypothetical protein SFX19_09620 [Alphaproteobacteria bacterium]|nr:hypothetical protein [Alphaproteobacteria bacterium]